MKIVHIITLGGPIGGAQKHVIDLCIRLHENGHEVIVLTGKAGELTTQLTQRNIHCEILDHLKRPINPIHDFLLYKELKEKLIELAPDIVAAHSSKPGIVSRLVCSSLNLPNTFTVHGWSFAEGIPLFRRLLFIALEKIIGKFSNQLITVAEADRALGLKYNIVPPEKIKTIHNGVLPPNSDSRQALPLKENAPLRLIMVARFQAQKDHSTLIESLLSLKHLNWELTFLGNGPKELEIKKMVKENGLSDKVFFEGAVNNVYDYLEKSDLYLLITNWEGFPLTILEGMGHGLPIIASDVGGVKEAVINGENGFLIERGNARQLQERIEELYNDKVLRQKMADKSLEMYQKDFTLERMFEKTQDVYFQLLEDKKTLTPAR